jgi:hypothetical protein
MWLNLTKDEVSLTLHLPSYSQMITTLATNKNSLKNKLTQTLALVPEN